ncbi:MAG: hypothetical protein PVI89_14310 [Desulfobacteraceae bacterium]|jgi:hypothetical protein
MKRIYLYLLASMVAVSALTGCCRPLHPTHKVIDVFSPAYAYRHVVPYEVNLYGIYILRHRLNWQHVERYIWWYLDHLNYPDKHGLTGSMYDFYLDDRGRQSNAEAYDSVDSYAATFLILLHEYYKRVGNRQLFLSSRKKIEDVAYLLIVLKDHDGLTRALPDRDSKYLMDNCEVYAGLKAYLALCRALDWSIPQLYKDAAQEIRQSVWTQLYDTSTGMFHWAVDSQTQHTSDWSRFYPDAFAQLFPIIYGLLDPASQLAQEIWAEFCRQYGRAEGLADSLQTVVISMARERMQP